MRRGIRVVSAAIGLSLTFAVGLGSNTGAPVPDARARAADLPPPAPQQGNDRTPQDRGGRGGGAAGVYKLRVEPHWFQGNTRFWY